MSIEQMADEQLADQSFRQIYGAIRSGVLAPGARFSETDLMEKFALTRAPLRNALTRLVHAGWVTALPRRGYVIKPITLRDVREVFDLRKLLEPEAARRAAGRVDKQLLEALNEAASRAYDPADDTGASEFFAANAALHTGIAMAAGNHRIAQLVQELHEESERILRVGMRHANWSQGWQHGHEELLSALIDGESELAAAVALRQLEFSERIVMDAITDLFDTVQITQTRN